jgi:hypothetical protein
MRSYIEHPGLIFGLFWAFWLFVSLGASFFCVLLSFIPKLSGYAYRIARVILWAIGPYIVLFFLAAHFDPADSQIEWLIGLFVTLLPVLPASLALLLSRKSWLARKSDGRH